MNKPKAPYTQFNQTRNVPIKVYGRDGYLIEGETNWDTTMWVERGEDWYGLMSYEKEKRIRIVTREDWLKSKRITTE